MISCLREMGPEERVRAFYADLMKEKELEDLAVHLTRKNILEAVDLPLKEHKLKSIKIISVKKDTETKQFITADLSYEKSENLIDVRKVVEVNREGEDWKIRAIENIKTYIEMNKNIDIKK